MSRDAVVSLTGLERQWEDALDPTTHRPVFQRISMPPRLSLNGLLLSLLCTLLLVFIGFIPVSLPTPLEFDRLNQPGTLAVIQFTFLIPLALLIAAFLGPVMGTLSALLYLAIGLAVAPVFANGGGWAYVFQPGFGYLAALPVVGLFVGRSFYKVFQKKHGLPRSAGSRSFRILLLAVFAVLAVHTLGLLYLFGLGLLGQVAWADMTGRILRLSVEPLPYDILSVAVFLCLVRQIRLGLWLVLY